jgi:DHA1 family multidrug resistance protein-like MFS transporter
MLSVERRNIIFVSFLGFLVSLGFGLIIPIMPYYVEILGGGAAELGILVATFMATRALLARYFGGLSDVIGRKKIIVAGALLYAFLGFAFTLPSHWVGLILVRGAQGVASALVWPVGEALIVDSSSEERRGTALSIYLLSSNVGFAAGPFVGGFLLWAARNPLGIQGTTVYHVPFYFLAVFSGIAALLVQTLVRDVAATRRDERMEARSRAERGPIPKDVRRQVNILFLNNLGNGLSHSLIAFLPVFYMKDFLGLDETAAGILIGLAATVGMLVNLPAGYVSDRVGRKPLVILGGYVARGSAMFIPFTANAYQLAGLMVFRSFAFQMSAPALKALQADLFPKELRGRLIGTTQTLFNLGAIFGALIGGALYSVLMDVSSLPLLSIPGVAVPFIISSLLGITTTSLVLVYVRETKKARVEEALVPAEL